jgi:hypothetical protein
MARSRNTRRCCASANSWDDAAIAEQLQRDGLLPCRGDTFTPIVVQKLRLRNGILLGLEKARRGDLPPCFTLNELTRRFGVHPSWSYQEIITCRLVIEKHPHFHCYLFPRTRDTIKRLQQLRRHEVVQGSFPKGAV